MVQIVDLRLSLFRELASEELRGAIVNRGKRKPEPVQTDAAGYAIADRVGLPAARAVNGRQCLSADAAIAPIS